jgi:hypothetical protein
MLTPAAQAYSRDYAVTMSNEKRGGSHEGRSATAAAGMTALIGALSDAQQLADSNDLDALARVEFRNALDHIRDTTSAVQKLFEAHSKSANAYAVLPILTTQRVRRAAQLARDLSLDLENMDITVETDGLQDLYQTIGQLNRKLEILCKRGGVTS